MGMSDFIGPNKQRPENVSQMDEESVGVRVTAVRSGCDRQEGEMRDRFKEGRNGLLNTAVVPLLELPY